MRRSSSSRSCCWYARRDAHVADPAGRRAGSSSAMTRFMNSAYRASASARWQTTSSVDQRPGTGLARTCSAVIPATASRTSCGPDKYSRTSCAWYTVLPFPFTPGLGPCRHTSEPTPSPRVRLLRVAGKNADVWLLTDVRDSKELSHATAAQFYRWRWRNEGLFRTYKRTISGVKFRSRTVAQVHREAEGSLLAVQILLAHAAWELCAHGQPEEMRVSARQVLVLIRQDIILQVGMYLGP